MKFKKLIFVSLCLPLLCMAGTGDECVNTKAGDEKELCIARTRVNAGNCERIISMGLRADCFSMVKHKQRQLIWAIKPLNAQTVQIRGESTKAYGWMR